VLAAGAQVASCSTAESSRPATTCRRAVPWTGVQRHAAKISAHIAAPAKPKPQVSKPGPAPDSQRDRRQGATVALLSDRAPPRGFSTYPEGLASRSNGSGVMRASMGGMTS
jgi:hypothetical protein